MESNKILNADILDIIFDGRNKAYGAYELRKTYQRRITIALGITFGICLLFVLYSFASRNSTKVQKIIEPTDVVLDNSPKEEKKPEPPPPPPPPKPEPPKVEMAKFTPPKIVKDNEVKEDEKPPEVEKLEDVKIGTKTQEGIKDEGIVAPPVEEGTGKVEAPKEEDYDKIFTSVEIQASYPGGEGAWRKYLERNLNSNVPVDYGAPAGRYTVRLSFIVDKNGNVSDIVAQNDPGYGTKEEAIRVVKKAGRWEPANQNGRKVAAHKNQSITFEVTSD